MFKCYRKQEKGEHRESDWKFSFNPTKYHLTPNSLRKPLKEKVGDREKRVNVNGRRNPKQRSQSQFKRSLSEVCRIIQRESTETLERAKRGAQPWRKQRRRRFDQNKEFISCRLKKGLWELKGKEFEAVHDNRSYRQTRERRLEEMHKDISSCYNSLFLKSFCPDSYPWRSCSRLLSCPLLNTHLCLYSFRLNLTGNMVDYVEVVYLLFT